ncbi:MAG: NAD(P)/FAD-dependent oxidoreductase [Bacteriovoracales bacterium]|nr:NAD(P)/FAD-dependent oxidoreductase [Bacteriovoracales bacterium]
MGPPKSPILVIGAGLVGPVWASMLKELGIEVSVYEKRADPRKGFGERARSVNLVITSRGVHALQKIGLWKKISPFSTTVLGRMIHHREGPASYTPYGRNERECNYSISRSELNRLLLDEAESRGVELFFEHPLTRIDREEGKALFENGKSIPFTQLFGADGGGSAVRASMARGLSGVVEKSEIFHVGYKEMTMPPKANGEYAMEKKALHIWPREEEMLMGLPNPGGSFTMTLFAPKKRLALLENEKAVEDYFETHYPDALPLMPHYRDEFLANPQGAFGTVRFSPWVYEDRICLLGDAAHGIVPFFGQGLNAGLEDCSLLYDLWRELGDWKRVFVEFDRFQRPNGNAIATMALENYVEMSSRTGDPRFLLRKEIERKVEAAFPTLYRSRYGMVTYTLIPYHLVYEAGKIQDDILNELMEGVESAEDLDFNLARSLVEKKLAPFLRRHLICLDG